MFKGFNISASALTAQRLRMDVTSSNMANAETSRGRLVNGEWEPYRRKMTVMEPQNRSFSDYLNRSGSMSEGNGVKISGIVEDQTPFKQIYNPEHPDAGEDGFTAMPNVDPLKEMVDLMSAARSYEANVTALDAHKNILLKALEIGR
ncbi:flagellar basal body rod protein FlgC [Alteribacter lacisalsi]|uniref:Flagellar basal-body rod protein FlgC n=1 Tax=Alteribacter lacisalsi TaxID=2045244 RepID=A0A2W0H836_9BACI|nr:flagellar basal body rod protein FlgC [Alteribacter lacisalsi]PYZ98014.1 flagellar basal body rod protein FlgC [Alteribacter lacisalsi]